MTERTKDAAAWLIASTVALATVFVVVQAVLIFPAVLFVLVGLPLGSLVFTWAIVRLTRSKP